MTLTDEQTFDLVKYFIDSLNEVGANDILLGIEESRLAGIEEPTTDVRLNEYPPKSELKKLGTVRRRPLSNLETLQMIFERLRGRLVILPAVARSLTSNLGTQEIVWRLETDFISPDQTLKWQADLQDLLPAGVDELEAILDDIREVVPEAFIKVEEQHG